LNHGIIIFYEGTQIFSGFVSNMICHYFSYFNLFNNKLIALADYSLENTFLNKKSKLDLFII